MSNNSGTNGITTAYTKQQIEQCQEIVQNLRVHELHQLLSIFQYPKLGKKQELVQRAHTVLSNPKYQTKAAQKVLQIQANSRIREAMHPYSPTGSMHQHHHQQQQHPASHHHQQFSAATGGGHLPPPAVSSPSVIALHPGSAAAAAAGMARGSAGAPPPPPPFNQQQQMFASANAAAYAANLAAYHQFFQMTPHNFANPPPAAHHHPQQQLMAIAQQQQQQHHHHQQNGQAQSASGGGGQGGTAAAAQHHLPNQYQRPQQHPQPTVVPQHGAGGQLVRNLRVVELPFYDLVKVIVPMTELPPYPVSTRPGDARAPHSFGVPIEDLHKVHYRSEEQPLPRYELQLRVFLLETSEEQQDAFPPGSLVRLDDYQVQLPPVIPTNKPNAEQRRYPRPVNITPYAQPPRGLDRPHRLHFEWNGDKRAWAFTVTLVKRVNSEILLDRILKNPNARRPLEKTKQMIIRRLNGDEDDVQMDSLKISLMDPLMRTRIKIPARAAECTHLQCFDLNSYLMMSEKRPTWKCPVCDRNAIYSMLIIDGYFEQVLSQVAAGVDEVELLRDGTWRLPVEADAMGVDSDEEDAAGTAAAADPTKANVGGGVDDDDDDIIMVTVPVPKKRVAGPVGTGDAPPVASSADASSVKQSSSSSARGGDGQQQQKRMPPPASSATAAPTPDLDIICLSSDDEEEAGQMAQAIAASSRLQQQQQGVGAESGKEMMAGATAVSSSSTNSVDASLSNNNISGGLPINDAAAASSPAQNGRSNVGVALAEGTVTVSGGEAAVVPQNEATGVAERPLRPDAGAATTTTSANTTTTNNNSPTLRVNGVHPPIFRPAIDQAAKRQIAHSLAIFLQGVCSKNNKS